jgi:hypothetical protein
LADIKGFIVTLTATLLLAFRIALGVSHKVESNSPKVPYSTTFPSSTTAIIPAIRAVLNLWLIRRVVCPLDKLNEPAVNLMLGLRIGRGSRFIQY